MFLYKFKNRTTYLMSNIFHFNLEFYCIAKGIVLFIKAYKKQMYLKNLVFREAWFMLLTICFFQNFILIRIALSRFFFYNMFNFIIDWKHIQSGQKQPFRLFYFLWFFQLLYKLFIFINKVEFNDNNYNYFSDLQPNFSLL